MSGSLVMQCVEAPVVARDRLRIGTLEIDALTQSGALDAIEELVNGRRGGFVVTANVHHVVVAEHSQDFRAAYAVANLSLADGQPIVWCSRLLDVRLPEKISGSDLVVPLLDRAAARKWRVFLLGSPPGVADAVAEKLTRERSVTVVGTAAPMVRGVAGEPDPEGDAAAEEVRATRPDLVLVAFGAPKQELWMHRHREALAPAVLLGIGASLDFLAGRSRRAPRWVSHAGLEWLWRLAREPRRLWRRYLLVDPAFLGIFLRTRREASGRRRS